MAKKKKTQLKPVARGFATISVPKKVVQTEGEPEVESATGSTEEELPKADNIQNNRSNVTTQATSDEFELEKVEEQSLQNLVDKLQDKTEKEVSRTVKVRKPSSPAL
jgi:hypothetical protein